MPIPHTLDQFAEMTWRQATAWLCAINVAVFLLSLAVGEILVRVFHGRRAAPEPDPLDRREIFWAATCVLLNGGVAVAGWFLWRAGVIRVHQGGGLMRVARDVVVLLMAMDFLMYVFHRLAHLRWIYPLVHRTHHLYDRPRPLNLFVLNPAEVLGFGALWLALLSVYPATWPGVLIYLTLNLAFGTVGHLGVEPFPRSWGRLPVLKHIGSSTFHAGHHQDGGRNFGFYTDVWDRVFGTTGRDAEVQN